MRHEFRRICIGAQLTSVVNADARSVTVSHNSTDVHN
jgi:hypothetical protein